MMNFKFAKYRIAVSNCDHRGDAKIWDQKYRGTMTDNQKLFENDIIANRVKHIIPKGPNSKLGKVNLSNGVPVLPADIKSYRIFGSNKAKVKVWQKILF